MDKHKTDQTGPAPANIEAGEWDFDSAKGACLSPLETPKDSSRIKVVLCQPEGSYNVGSVCRAMRSMGFDQLYITGREKSFFQQSAVELMAVSSYPLFEKARFAPDLSNVVQDCSTVVGLTRRRGSRRKYFSLVPEQLAERISTTEGNIALLFGNERVGLNDEELSYCHLACHIPTHPAQPSLNLSHAVQLILYQISRLQKVESGLTPISYPQTEQLSIELTEDMIAMGVHDHLQNQRTEVFLRDILARAQLSPKEALRLKRIFTTMRYHRSKAQS